MRFVGQSHRTFLGGKVRGNLRIAADLRQIYERRSRSGSLRVQEELPIMFRRAFFVFVKFHMHEHEDLGDEIKYVEKYHSHEEIGSSQGKEPRLRISHPDDGWQVDSRVLCLLRSGSSHKLEHRSKDERIR